MKRHAPIFCLLFGFSTLAIMMAGCTQPSDPISYGELCLPSTDSCPDHVELERPFSGRNALEFTLRAGAVGQSTAVVRVVTDRDLDLPDERKSTEEGGTILFEEEYPLGDGEILSQGLTSFHLTVVSDLRLELECIEGDCDHHLEFLYLVDSLECVEQDSGVCGRHEFCEVEYGRCAECIDDDQCDGSQGCDRETGYCNPGETTGCNVASSTNHPLDHRWLFAAALLVVFTIALGRRRRIATAAMLAITAASLLTVTPSVAEAESGASMHIGGGMRLLTGDAGELTHPGWGITVSHQLRWQHLGASFELSTNSFGLTDEAAIERGQLMGYGVSFSPQYYIPIPVEVATVDADAPLEGILSAGYTRWSVAENRIARVTGLDLNYHGVGPGLGLRWRWGDLEFTSTARYLHIFDWPGSLFSLDVTIGFSP